VDEPHTFPNVADHAVWKTFNNMEEMIAACQVPDNILKHLSTENLIITCMNYPLFFTYSAYNNELDGIKILMDHFNGFQELRKRDSAAEQLIDYYSEMNVEAAPFDRRANNSILHMGYIELVLASEKIPNVFEAQNVAKLEKDASAKLQEKLSHTDLYSIFSVRKSLVLGVEITLQKNMPIKKESKALLENFVKS
jgi:hypothetical protein